MLKKKNPKKPSDYKTLRIRVPLELEKDLVKIMDKVEKLKNKSNRKKDPTRRKYAGNHILLEAIDIGLKQIEKRVV